MIQIGASLDKGSARFGHFATVDGHEPMHIHSSRSSEIGLMQHGRPKQAVEVDNILTNEMVNLRVALGTPDRVEIEVMGIAPFFKCTHVTNGCIQPDIEIGTRVIWDLKPEIGCITRDIPAFQTPIDPFREFVRHFRLESARSRPLFEKIRVLAKLKEQVLRVFEDRCLS